MAIIVIHSKITERITGTCCMEWRVCTGNRIRGGHLTMRSRKIDADKARMIIAENGLVEAHRTQDGEIYDTPQRDFKALFPDGLRNRNEIEQIEKTDRT